jgi:hypothetical protein
MSIKPMRQSTNLIEQINETLEFIYLTQDEHYGLEIAVKYFLKNCDEIDRDYFCNRRWTLTDTVEKLQDIVLTPKEDL